MSGEAFEELGSADGGRVRCLECGEALGAITWSHLSKHGMTPEEYTSKYPGAPTAGAAMIPDG